MIKLTSTQRKVLEIYHNEGHIKAWNYWKLIGNTYGIFLGEVLSNKFIDGETLANHIGLTDGMLCNINTSWLKFLLDGNIIYVAKKPLMHSVPWDAIKDCGAVFENEGATIEIDSNTYDITLLRGVNRICILSGQCYGYDMDYTHTSEWNRLMYPIHSGIHTDNDNPTVGSVPYAQWATYSDSDLDVGYTSDSGEASWVQESRKNDMLYGFVRGYNGVTSVNRPTSSHANSSVGWRPALRFRY